MNYEKLTKVELLVLVEEQKKKLDEQVHLASAVDTKDQEILKLQEDNKQLKKEVAEEKARMRSAFQEDRDALILKFEEEKQKYYTELKANYESKIKILTDQVAELNGLLQKAAEKRVVDLNRVLFAYGDLMKILQGSIDSHMKLNELIIKDLTGGE